MPSGIDLPAMTLNVVPPASLEMEAAQLEVKPGTTTELKGKINRKGRLTPRSP